MNWASWLNTLAASTGARVESSDLTRLQEYEAAVLAGTTTQAQFTAFQAALTEQYQRRGASTAHRRTDSQLGGYSDDPRTEPGYRTQDTGTGAAPPAALIVPIPVVSVVTTSGATQGAEATPTVGPVGLAYPDDPINYSTMQQSPSYGYSGPGSLPSGVYPTAGGGGVAAPVGGNTMVYLLLAAAAAAAYFLLRK